MLWVCLGYVWRRRLSIQIGIEGMDGKGCLVVCTNVGLEYIGR